MRLGRVFGVATLLVAAAPLFYLLVALLLGLLPVNADWRPTPAVAGGVPVYLRTNGVHADLVLPAGAPHDFAVEFPRHSIVDRARVPAERPLDWLAFGWGDRDFYLNTPTWADLEAGTAWRALTAQGPSAMHVEYLARPEDYAVQVLWLSPAEYERLITYVRRHFRRDAAGAPIRIEHPGYGPRDVFFEGEGSYSAIMTSNEWVRRALAQTGVRTARWAPFDPALFWQAARAMR